MDEELQDVVVENEEDTEVVEQPDAGTPDNTPEFALDNDGNLVWSQTDDSTDEDSDAETDEQPADEEDEVETTADEVPLYKVKVNGEEKEVPLDEILAGYMRQQDYTRKTQELAEQRKNIMTPAPPQVEATAPQAESTEDLLEIAKQMAVRKLNLESVNDLSELSFEHTIAVMEAKQSLELQKRDAVQRQMNIVGMEEQLRLEDPAYDEILAYSSERIQDLPHKEFMKLQKAYESGDPAPLRAFYLEQKKNFYADKVKSSTVPKKVPRVETSGNTPLQKQSKKIDVRQIGHMNSDQKAQMLIDLGIV